MYQSRAQYLLPGSPASSDRPYLSLSGTSQATPVVTGTIALLLQANPSLTPNAVKAILEYTAETYAGHSALAQGAGFLNARGAVELARQFHLPPAERGARPAEWSAHVVWGNYRLADVALTAGDGAWSVSAQWGAPGAATGGSVNVVWGTTCAGDNCSDRIWATSDDDTVVWGNSDSDIVVWGNSDGDTVVWGNSDDDIVVWGNSDEDTVVWGNTGDDDTCQSVIWPEA